MMAGGEFTAAMHRPIGAEEALLAVAGPFVANAHSLTSWAINAGPGLVCIYARAERPGRGGVGERARELQASGLIRLLPLRRVGDCLFDYRAERTALPFQQGRPVPDERGLSPDGRLLLELVATVADDREPCPSNRDLAALLGLKCATQAERLMAELHRRHLIDVEMRPGPIGLPVRVVRIADTGAETAGPVPLVRRTDA